MRFLSDQVAALSQRYEVWVIVNATSRDELPDLPAEVGVLPVRIERRPSPLNDLIALGKIVRLCRHYRFDLIHSITPKAGLLAMIASFVARVPIRIHTFAGEVWATRQGPSRQALKAADKVTASLATCVLVISRSERDFLLAERIVGGGSRVLASGSIAGVDTERFRPDPEARHAVRRELGIDEDDIVFLFVGRLNRDKGVLLLADAYSRVSLERTDCLLMFVGPDEEGLSRLPALADRPGILCIGPSTEPERYMAAADVFCLPSRREGFGEVLLEAAAAGIPTVASDVYGISDAVARDSTGLLHQPGDVTDLCRCMSRMAADADLRARFGASGRRRVIDKFQRRVLTEALLETYRDLLAER